MLTVFDKAQRRAQNSTSPLHYMAEFTTALKAVNRGADFDGWRQDLDDPTAVAAQIEALAASRIQKSYRHRKSCLCIACRVRRHDEHLDDIRTAVSRTEADRGLPPSGYEQSLAAGHTEDFASFDTRMTAANTTEGDRS